MVTRTSLAALVFVAACADEPASPIRDAAPLRDAIIAADVASPDALSDGRAASVVPCQDVLGIIMFGLTAEVTDWGGYIPTGDATMPPGYGARWAYADGGTQHAITSGFGGQVSQPDGLFASDPFDGHGAQTCIVFEMPGTYPYHCSFHPAEEQGTIIVEGR